MLEGFICMEMEDELSRALRGGGMNYPLILILKKQHKNILMLLLVAEAAIRFYSHLVKRLSVLK